MLIRNDFVTGRGSLLIQQGSVAGNGTVGGDVANNGGTISPDNSLVASAVPEPSTVLLLTTGLLLLFTRTLVPSPPR